MDKRPIGDSGITIAPLALGGNVFGWTADEAASFAVLDAFVDAGGTMIDTADVYSAWVPGHKGGESEALIGRWLKRDPGKRDKVVIATKVGFMAGLAPESIEPACDASLAAARGRHDRPLLPAQGRRERAAGESSSARSRALREQARSARSAFRNSAAAASTKPSRRRGAAAACRRARAPDRGTIWSSARRFEGELRDAAIRNGLGVFPYYSLANGFLTGKYRSKDDSRQKRCAAIARCDISKAMDCGCWLRSTRSRKRLAPRSRQSRWPG